MMVILQHKMKNFWILTGAILLASCGAGSGKTAQLEIEEFKSGIEESNVQIVDIRSEEEFKAGHIDNAINIDISSKSFDSLNDKIYPDLPVYIYGKNEELSKQASEKLIAQGFKQVRELKGAFQSWVKAGLPVVEYTPPKVYESDTIPFEKARMGNKLVLVDFNATWCKPCKILEPTIHKIHDTREKDVMVYSIDTDLREDLAREYSARSIPLLVYIKNNKVLYRSEGVVSESEINKKIDELK